MRITAKTRMVLPTCLMILVFFAGCMVPDSLVSSSRVPEGASPGQGSVDSTYLRMYENSQNDIAAKMKIMNRCFPASTAIRNAPYMATDLRTAAQELKMAADSYHTSMIKVESFEKKENELQRNEYLKYLAVIRKSAADIEGAAEGELNGEFALAQTYAESAQNSLKNIEGIPGTSHEYLLKEIRASLDDYIQKMRERRT